MDPHSPVDADDVLPQETADQPPQNRSDTEPPADTESTSAQEVPPADDKLELNDHSSNGKSDSVALPPETDLRDANAGPVLSDGAAITSSSGTDSGDAMPEPPAAFLDSTPAEADVGLDAEQSSAVNPIDVASLTDVIQPPGNRSLDVVANHAMPQDVWPEPNADFPAVGTQSSQLSSDIRSAGARAASAPMDSIVDHVGPLADPNASHERKFDNRAKHDGEPVTDTKSNLADSQPEPAPAERQAEKISREELEAFLEKFKDDGSRTSALLSPAFDGGPPMARPIVLVSLAEEQMQGITNEALAESGSRLAKTAAEVAEDKVNEAFWLRDCEMRALYRGR
jgi:hypothetical protein